MGYEKNPFQTLYVTDSPDPQAFVSLFSDTPVQYAQSMFDQGNVVIKGAQGTGKSMLLNLLKPQIRIAYSKTATDFPVAQDRRDFIGAGINLTRSGILDIGQRPPIANGQHDEYLFPLYFADFFNYHIVRDILRTVRKMADEPNVFDNLIQESNLDEFARALAGEDCWFNFLDSCDNFEALCKRMDHRLSQYRAFHQYNIPSFSEKISKSKTSIGEPIARVGKCLVEMSVIDSSVPVLIRIDQIERLYRSDTMRPNLGQAYRQMINKALGMRDSRVSYCVGTRPWAWEDDLKIYGTESQLEDKRDYVFIDLGEILGRKENPSTWIFPAFAEDVFTRRLSFAGYSNLPKEKVVKAILGSTISSPDLVKEVINKKKKYAPQFINKQKVKWDDNWNDFFKRQIELDPVQACFGAVWAQQGKRKGTPRTDSPPPKPGEPFPWDRPYWLKERYRPLLFQVLAQNAQRYSWSGKDAIYSLSAGNVSIFVSICHEIWAAYLRAKRKQPESYTNDIIRNGIPRKLQSAGIRLASTVWHEKITEQPKGHLRQLFVDFLGKFFRKQMLEDTKMSYPGCNGFSLANSELDAHPEIKHFISDLVDYGDFCEASHTTKEKNRAPRTKWYTMPILSDYFQISEIHTKEPYYAKINEVMDWLNQAGVLENIGCDISEIKRNQKSSCKDEDLPLFDSLLEEDDE